MRVRVGRRWREGTAQVLADTTRECQRTMPRGNAQVVRLMGSQLLNRPRRLEPGELRATATG